MINLSSASEPQVRVDGLMGNEFSSRVLRARAFYDESRSAVAAGLRSQTDAEESALRKLTSAGYDYGCSRRALGFSAE